MEIIKVRLDLQFKRLNNYSAWAAVTFQLHPGIIPWGIQIT